MYRLFIVLFSVSMVFSCAKDPVEPPTDPDPPTPPVFTLPVVENKGYDFDAASEEGWTKVWSDEFESDLSQWDTWNGGAFNNELQLYRASNLYLENNLLYIRGKRGQATGPTNPFDNTSKSFGFTSGRIETKEAFSPQSSGGTVRYAARMLLPAGEGLWPAFWSYNDPWPTMGEIDVMEFRGGDINTYKTNFFYGEEPNQVLTNSGLQSTAISSEVALTAEFHVYELEWTETDLKMFLDGNLVKSYNTEEFEYVDDMFDKSQNIVLNLAIGGDFFSDLDESQIPSDSYTVVDWVRVYTK